MDEESQITRKDLEQMFNLLVKLIDKTNKISISLNRATQLVDSMHARMPRRSGLSKAAQKKLAIYRRDGDKCWICGEVMRPTEMSLDHMIPKSMGGISAIENLKLAHPWCNHKRNTDLAPLEGVFEGWPKQALVHDGALTVNEDTGEIQFVPPMGVVDSGDTEEQIAPEADPEDEERAS